MVIGKPKRKHHTKIKTTNVLNATYVEPYVEITVTIHVVFHSPTLLTAFMHLITLLELCQLQMDGY